MTRSDLELTDEASQEEQRLYQLQKLIRTHPLIDHHAHNLLKQHNDPDWIKSLLSLTSEASGNALHFTASTLSHMRGIKMLCEPPGGLYECSPTLESIQASREKFGTAELYKKCLQEAGIQCILLDDGILPSGRDREAFYEWKEHDEFTKNGNKRIVRIEKVAENLLKEICLARRKSNPAKATADDFTEMITQFSKSINQLLRDPDVVGFKSVVAYRTGLDISLVPLPTDLGHTALPASTISNWDSFRLSHKLVNDVLVLETCTALSRYQPVGTKVFQFHTGLGDKDLNLVKSDPGHLQPLIKEYPNVPFVLLHASYPFSRQAAYLAAIYENVYTDLGEAFPQLSHRGQKAVLKEILEISPTSKILWSSDGRFWPETYWLAAKQFRAVFDEVTSKLIRKGHLTISQAEEIVKGILFENANKLYHLNLVPDHSLSSLLASKENNVPSIISAPSPEISANSNHSALLKFSQLHPTVEYIRLQWVDYANSFRCRVVPIEEMLNITKKNSFIGLTKAALALLQNCIPVKEGFTPAGMWDLVPDWESVRVYGTNGGKYAGVMCCFKERGAGASEDPTEGEVDICPRSALKKVLKTAKEKGNIKLYLGFETEVIFLERVPLQSEKASTCTFFSDSSEPFTYRPLSSSTSTKGHNWSVSRALHSPLSTSLIEEIHSAMNLSGIQLQQFHPEAAPGQFEFVTAPLEGIDAIDALYHTRETIQIVAEKFGLRATLHPKPFPAQIGTGSHIHFSINPANLENETEVDGEEAKALAYGFVWGILEQLRSIVMFSYSMEGSYERVKPGFWAGSSYICWGNENREAPIRRVGNGYGSKGGRWEFRCMDGLANVYLVLLAIVVSGLWGLEAEKVGGTDNLEQRMEKKRCDVDPASLRAEKKQELKTLPGSFEEALGAHRNDEGIYDPYKPYGVEKVVRRYVNTKEVEAEFLRSLGGDEEVKKWAVERW